MVSPQCESSYVLLTEYPGQTVFHRRDICMVSPQYESSLVSLNTPHMQIVLHMCRTCKIYLHFGVYIYRGYLRCEFSYAPLNDHCEQTVCHTFHICTVSPQCVSSYAPLKTKTGQTVFHTHHMCMVSPQCES